jgi:hypothetical protein
MSERIFLSVALGAALPLAAGAAAGAQPGGVPGPAPLGTPPIRTSVVGRVEEIRIADCPDQPTTCEGQVVLRPDPAGAALDGVIVNVTEETHIVRAGRPVTLSQLRPGDVAGFIGVEFAGHPAETGSPLVDPATGYPAFQSRPGPGPEIQSSGEGSGPGAASGSWPGPPGSSDSLSPTRGRG